MIEAIRLGTALVSALVLIAVNAIPLIGVMIWGWSLMMILVLYWVESGVVGVINIFKIAKAQGGDLPEAAPITINGNRITIRMSGAASSMARGPLIGFFILHYGIFWAVHGVFVFTMPLFAGLANPTFDPSSPSFGFAPMDFGPLPLDGLLLGAILLTARHVVSYFTNYIGRGEYLRATPAGQMLSVYGRVVVHCRGGGDRRVRDADRRTRAAGRAQDADRSWPASTRAPACRAFAGGRLMVLVGAWASQSADEGRLRLWAGCGGRNRPDLADYRAHWLIRSSA